MARLRDPDFLNRLAHAGMRVFARKGLKRARMSDVALVLGVSQGTLYNYVESKEALFYLLVDWGMRDDPLELPDTLPIKAPPKEDVLARLETQIAARLQLTRLDAALLRDEPAGNARDELTAVLEELYDLLAATREPAAVIERSAMDSPELFSLFFLKVRRSVFARVAAYIEARAERGYFRAYPDADAAARVVVETVAVFARRRHKDPDPQPADEATVRGTVVEMLVHSLLNE
jgi:AcrR family transcriptional regulator